MMVFNMSKLANINCLFYIHSSLIWPYMIFSQTDDIAQQQNSSVCSEIQLSLTQCYQGTAAFLHYDCVCLHVKTK